MGWSRRTAIRLMVRCGWSYSRVGRVHTFRRPDTGGLWDRIDVTHKNLSLDWALTRCGDFVLASRVYETRMAWAKEVIPAAFEEPDSER